MKVKEFLKRHRKGCIVAGVLVVILAGISAFVSRANKAAKMDPIEATV